MEVSHPAVVEQMLSKATVYERKTDGTLVNQRGLVKWAPAPASELTRSMDSLSFIHPTEAGCQIANQDLYICVAGGYCFELPTAILDVIAKEPTGEIAEMYRGYVRHSLMPFCRRVVDQLRELMSRDKKASDAGLRLILVQSIGEAVVVPDVPEALIAETISAREALCGG